MQVTREGSSKQGNIQFVPSAELNPQDKIVDIKSKLKNYSQNEINMILESVREEMRSRSKKKANDNEADAQTKRN